ncbi:MAG: LacI family DNA-binding transcriptional regulator [Janthinobacterium lividum]
MADLAQQLGLATSTISRALADHPDVSEATKVRVRQAAQEVNYTRNTLAASLRHGRSNTLGIIVPHLDGFFFPAVINSMEKLASKAGFGVLIGQSHEDVGCERQQVARLLAAQVSAIIVAVAAGTGSQTQHLEQVRQQGVPLIFFDRLPELAGSHTVVLDDRAGACRAVAHLLAQGCRRVAHLAGPQHLSTHHNRYLGYCDALRAHGLPIEKELVQLLPGTSQQHGRVGMRRLLALDQRPDALFTACGMPAAGALAELTRRNIQVPHDMALACFNNAPFTNLVQPPLTVVDQQAEQMGAATVATLLQVLQAGAGCRPTQVILPTKLRIRKSSLHLLGAAGTRGR